MKRWILLVVFAVLLFSLHLARVAHAQFAGEFGAVSGVVSWGTETYDNTLNLLIRGNNTGFFMVVTSSTSNYSTGMFLPPDTYTVTARFAPTAGGGALTTIGSQTVSVGFGQSINVNFDAQAVTGLVKGSLKVNGVDADGYVQFCGPLETDPCPMDLSEGLAFEFPSSGFRIAIAPGDYRVQVMRGDIGVGILPMTVTVGEIIDLATTSVSVPAGQNVTVSLAGITVTFSEVTTSGFMTVTTTTHPQGGNPPSQYRFLGTYYELTTTATYTGPATIQFTYNDTDVRGREENLKLFHWDGTQWVNITVSVDTVNNIITGVIPTLSPFAIGEPLNTPPTVDAGGPYQVNEGGTVLVSATGSDPENGVLTYIWDLDNNGDFETFGQSVSFSAVNLDGPSTYTVRVRVTDEGGLTASDEATIGVVNVAPTATFNTTSPLNEGSISNLSLTNVFDAGEADTSAGFHYSFACDGQVSSLASSYITAGSQSSASCPFADNGNYIVKGRVFDKDGGFTTYDAAVVVNNVAPVLGTITAPADPVQVNTAINASVSFTDPGIPDTHSAVWDWGDSTTSGGTVSGGLVTGNHIYTAAGVYTLKVTLTDDDGGSAQQIFQFVVIYDPTGDFVTGGGWIDSPAGAYIANTTLTGKANFGFVSKYEPGANVPSGNTKFQFKVGDLNFSSTVYEWLVVAGPNAKYKGSGTINGQGDYGFMLTARDGQINGGGGVDKFRIKIWDKATGNVVYDNQLGASDDSDATDAIEGGSIVIHQ